MKVSYRMERKLTFEEMCEVVLRFRKEGFEVKDYNIIGLNDDGDQMFICMQDSTQDFEIIIDEYSVELFGFAPKKALEKYETIIDCLEIE